MKKPYIRYCSAFYPVFDYCENGFKTCDHEPKHFRRDFILNNFTFGLKKSIPFSFERSAYMFIKLVFIYLFGFSLGDIVAH